jgi:hypothetical protein
MKKILLFLGLLGLATSVNADFVASGTIVKFHVASDNFGIYLKSTKGCPSEWYYSFRKESEPDTWKMLFDLSLLAYDKGKSLSIFYTSGDCNLKRFTAIDTIN